MAANGVSDRLPVLGGCIPARHTPHSEGLAVVLEKEGKLS